MGGNGQVIVEHGISTDTLSNEYVAGFFEPVPLQEVDKLGNTYTGTILHMTPAEKLGDTNKYIRTIHGVEVDVYDVLKAWEVRCPATQHAIKKLLMPGQRGSKDVLQDLKEAEQAIRRAIELEEG